MITSNQPDQTGLVGSTGFRCRGDPADEGRLKRHEKTAETLLLEMEADGLLETVNLLRALGQCEL
ncbi:hypothetical protein [Bradyrhizobium aeschynomenes]|uniref:hypothetical protein n=1 Tax=Bradyrhizobium aeschynomenes TaxID=2734909 RepID=UPI0015558BC3|nr:hypothetical protein [Bradyrhizobium aeschynomenes]